MTEQLFDGSKRDIVASQSPVPQDHFRNAEREAFDTYLSSVHKLGDDFDCEVLIEEIDYYLECNKDIPIEKLALCYRALAVVMSKKTKTSNRTPYDTCFDIIENGNIDVYYKLPAFQLIAKGLKVEHRKSYREAIMDRLHDPFIDSCAELMIGEDESTMDPIKKMFNGVAQGKDAQASMNVCEKIASHMRLNEKKKAYIVDISRFQAEFLSVFLTARHKDVRNMAHKEWDAYWQRQLNATDNRMIGPGIKGLSGPG